MMTGSLRLLLPEAAVLVSALFGLLASALPRMRGREAAWLGAAGALAGAVLAALAGRGTLQVGDATLAIDGTAQLARVATCALVALFCLWAAGSPASARSSSSSISLVLLSCVGCLLTAGARDWITLLVALEAAVLPTLVLLGPAGADRHGGEGAIRLVVAHAAGTMLAAFGIALLLASSPSPALAVTDAHSRAGWMAAALVAGGLLAKLGAGPFDVPFRRAFIAAPPWAVGVASSIPKAALALAAARAVEAFAPQVPLDGPILYGAGAVSMTWGLVGLFRESDVRAVLARSGALHAGFVAIALGAGGPLGLRSAVVYALAFALPSLTLGLVLEEEGSRREELAGLARRRRLPGLAVAVCALSLIGVVPTIGFLGKLYVLDVAVRAGAGWVAGAAVVVSLASVIPYGRLIKAVLAADVKTAEERVASEIEGRTIIADLAIAAGLVAIIALGILLWPALSLMGLWV